MTFHRRHLYWLIPLVVFDVLLFRWMLKDRPFEKSSEEPGHTGEPHGNAMRSSLALARPPTDHPALTPEGDWTEALQPTASGRPESARYGSTRKGWRAGRLRPTFHEGLDITALARDRRGMPSDDVLAMADGYVAYINRVAGNSNYGRYVVLLHDDPIGPVYTLYAHLEKIDRNLKQGVSVLRGKRLGRMGCSPNIPRARGHVHVEVGLLLNERFDAWSKAQKLKSTHGLGHGWNLYGLDPEVFLRRAATDETFSVKSWLQEYRPAFNVVTTCEKPPDGLSRYPGLWKGDPFRPGEWITIEATANGVPLGMRLATPDERAMAGDGVVVYANEAQLDQDGARLVESSRDTWRLTRLGQRWLDILKF